MGPDRKLADRLLERMAQGSEGAREQLVATVYEELRVIARRQLDSTGRYDHETLSLAPEGGAHQSIATPLIGIAQDGLASFEPAFADELASV